MAEFTLKDLNYTAYELGVGRGRELIKQYGDRGKNDPLELLEALWPDRSLDEFEEMLVEEGAMEDVVETAKNFMDGIEDGVRGAMVRWLRTYKQSFD